MPKGTGSAAVGTERLAANGYTWIKTEDRGWIGKHWAVWEEANGRQVNPEKEMIRFKDGDRTNFAIENIICIAKNNVQLRQKLVRLYVQRDEVAAQIKYYEDLLEQKTSSENE